MEQLILVKWQNLSGDWFSDSYPAPMAHVIFDWKCGTPNQAAEMHTNGNIQRWTK
jgi:hypothetical protein